MDITRITRRSSRTKNKTDKIDRSGIVPFTGVVKTTIKGDGSTKINTPSTPEGPKTVKVEVPTAITGQKDEADQILIDQENTEGTIDQTKKRDTRKTRRRVS